MFKSFVINFLLIVVQTALIAVAYENFYRSSLQPRLWIFGLFLVVVLFSALFVGYTKFYISRKDKIVAGVDVFAIVLLTATLKWGLKTFPLADVSQVLMTVQMPLDGFTSIFVFDFMKSVPLLCFIAASILATPLACFYKLCNRRVLIRICLFSLFVMGNAVYLIMNVSIASIKQYACYWIKDNETKVQFHSAFFNDNYILSDESFVEKKDSSRNLILIFLESIEKNFLEYMPELNELKLSNMYFNNVEGGGSSVEGADFTIASMVSNTMGLPLLFNGILTEKISNANERSFFKNQKSLFDILQSFGYKNVYLQGSPSDFAGTKLFYEKHGVSQVYDTENVFEQKDIGKSYRIASFRPGFTDRTLFDIAKKVLDTLSTRSNFSLTMATIDTHYPHGFYDEKCGVPLIGNNDESVMRTTLGCLSKNLKNFIDWLNSQPYAENTEVVLIGDHPFMGSVLVSSYPKEERKFVNVFINPLQKTTEVQRRFTAFDMYPTILESMGFSIRGGCLGFGCSLLQKEKTLIEKLGLDSMNVELKRMSNSVEYQKIF